MQLVAAMACDQLNRQIFLEVEDLLAVKGFTPEIVNKLRPFVTVLPDPTPVNVNTAPPEVLNCFAYTCAFSVCAALGGAAAHPGVDGLVTVDAARSAILDAATRRCVSEARPPADADPLEDATPERLWRAMRDARAKVS